MKLARRIKTNRTSIWKDISIEYWEYKKKKLIHYFAILILKKTNV